ncbi:hypothetical protein EYZ11_007051 [Aspergillus tanneri]|uniref:Phosphatidylglycerol lysyltransferase C-terminal domain-containing protein n=1 Tax=Aspergillus tanneri TaxID=1220188 RepID=A0A4S3JDX4_9EURO|nr:uncharacterized protein ATNIH1004_005213 [Aspergillus tanneri]KAA8649312.1 hypothetical protein ATNIH1004_005213 [Aspergillus tanneri]THC93466.1 hypothetical protein EYZ11_007051 [Aspergillus tanneri]
MANPPGCDEIRPRRGSTKGRVKPPKQPKAAKKELLLDTVGPFLMQQLDEHPKPDHPHLYSLPWFSQPNGQLFPHHTPHHVRLSRSNSSDRSSSNSSHTLVDASSLSDTPSDRHSGRSSSPALREPRTFSFLKRRRRPVTMDENPDTQRQIVESLAARYGSVSHMGMLDRSYRFFVNKDQTGALCYKVLNHVAIVSGDPLCEPDQFDAILDEFARYRKRHSWELAFMGASEVFAKYARKQRWNTMQFGVERVLNPRTNDVLLERSSKRVLVQNRQLLHPDKGGITLGVYVPAYSEDLAFQSELMAIYDAWREQRNQSATSTSQAFITVYNPFDFPNLMTFLYTRGPDGTINGFAALRRVGANNGYHIDPCIAAPGAPKGITDLLTYAAMALLHRADVSHLSLGYEPLTELGEISGMSLTLERITRSMYHHTYQRLPIRGKKAYHDKFRPDASQESGLYVVFPAGAPGIRQMLAIAHMANISIRKLMRTKIESNPTKGSKKEESR